MTKSLKILVAEHDRDLAEGLCDILELAGHRVHSALSLEKARELVRHNDFDVAFVNVNMPEHSKLESFAEIRKIKPDAKLVMMSAHTVDQMAAEVSNGGLVRVLGAPVEIDSVVETLEAIGPEGTLLIEEVPANFAETVRQALGQRNQRVAIARNRDEALALPAGEGCDVLLLDLRRSVVWSLEVFFELKQQGCALPTIIFQSYAEDGPACNDVAHSEILFKPFDPAVMVELLDRMAGAEQDGKSAAVPAAAPEPHDWTGGHEAQDDTEGAESERGEVLIWDDPAPLQTPDVVPQEPSSDPRSEAPQAPEPGLDRIHGLGAAQEPEAAPPADVEQPRQEKQPDESPDTAGVPARADAPVADAPVTETPVADARAAEGQAPEDDPEAVRVLVVDDDEDMAEGLAEILDDSGLEVKVAHTADSALDALKDFDARIALVDIQLGRNSGLELIPDLKVLRPGLIVVMVTAQTEQQSAIQAIRKGAFDYLNKPLHPEELLAAMDRCFEALGMKTRRPDGGEGAASGSDILDDAGAEYLTKLSQKLRTPLNAVVGFSEILSEEMLGPLGSSQYAAYANDIKEAGKHLVDVIEDFADIDRSESGKLELNETAVDLTGVIFRCLELIQPAVDAGDLTVEIELAEIPVFLIGDEHKLSQAVLSLLTNAVKFTPKHGRIRFVQRRADDGGLFIEVMDNGVGVAEEVIAQALSSVIESDGGLDPEYQGSGLGLPLTTSIVELHGGTLRLDSQVGEGTTAALHLPPDRNIAPKRAAAG